MRAHRGGFLYPGTQDREGVIFTGPRRINTIEPTRMHTGLCPCPGVLAVWKSHRFLVPHWLNRKNCCVPEMGLVTTFCPLTTTGEGRLVVQILEARSVVDCTVKPVKLVGQVSTTLDRDGVSVSSGASEMVKIVP